MAAQNSGTRKIISCWDRCVYFQLWEIQYIRYQIQRYCFLTTHNKVSENSLFAYGITIYKVN